MPSLRKMTVVFWCLRNRSRATSTLQFLKTSFHWWLVLPHHRLQKGLILPCCDCWRHTHLPGTSEVSLSSSYRYNTGSMVMVGQVLGTQALNSHLWARHGNLLWCVEEISWLRHCDLWKEEMRTRRENRKRKDSERNSRTVQIVLDVKSHSTHVYMWGIIQ